jgi:uncharacterized protein YegP (UPF0339 family)
VESNQHPHDERAPQGGITEPKFGQFLHPLRKRLFYPLSRERGQVTYLPEPRFEWYKDKAGKFRFRLVAPNGQTIAVSEGYETKDACVNGIESVKKNAPIAKIVEAKQ